MVSPPPAYFTLTWPPPAHGVADSTHVSSNGAQNSFDASVTTTPPSSSSEVQSLRPASAHAAAPSAHGTASTQRFVQSAKNVAPHTEAARVVARAPARDPVPPHVYWKRAFSRPDSARKSSPAQSSASAQHLVEASSSLDDGKHSVPSSTPVSSGGDVPGSTHWKA